MKLRIFTEPQQGATYEGLLAVAQQAEALGFNGFFRSDHYLKMGAVDGGPGPTDAWATLAALARETRRIRLGTLVTSATFRLPGPLAVTVAQVDQMSGGRIELGIGAGWYEDEHRAYAIPFPPLGERFDRLEEQLEILTGMWTTPPGEQFHHDGHHYPIPACPVLTRPTQAPLPIIVGGKGPRRTPALAARFASEFNMAFVAVDDFVAQRGRVQEACDHIGRAPASLVYSAALVVACGRNEAEVERRAAAIGRQPAELRAKGAAGSVAQVVDTLGRWASAGAERLYLQVLDLTDHDHLDLLGTEVLAQVR